MAALVPLAGTGPVLELGIGTGRMTLPCRSIIEAFVPDLTRFDRGQRLAVMAMGVAARTTPAP